MRTKEATYAVLRTSLRCCDDSLSVYRTTLEQTISTTKKCSQSCYRLILAHYVGKCKSQILVLWKICLNLYFPRPASCRFSGTSVDTDASPSGMDRRQQLVIDQLEPADGIMP